MAVHAKEAALPLGAACVLAVEFLRAVVRVAEHAPAQVAAVAWEQRAFETTTLAAALLIRQARVHQVRPEFSRQYRIA